MDILFIQQLKVTTTIGVYAWEQAIYQPLLFDLQLGYDITPAATSDDLRQALNYVTVCEVIAHHLAQHRFALLERVAETVATLLQQRFDIRWLQLHVTKLGAVANAQAVGVMIERGQPPS